MEKSISKEIEVEKITMPFCLFVFWVSSFLQNQYFQKPRPIQFEISIKNPADKTFFIDMKYQGNRNDTLELIMPSWTTGYYQFLHFGKQVHDVTAINEKGMVLITKQSDQNKWKIAINKSKTIYIRYQVNSTVPFVATNFIDQEHAFLSPAGLFMYPVNEIRNPVTVKVNIPTGWTKIATGMDTLPGLFHTYYASDFDMLYDSPLLIGDIEDFPSFKIKNVPHYFKAYKAHKNFDRKALMKDVEKIVTQGIQVIGDIPYSQYTFIGTGPGRGGIEHINSTTLSFTGDELNNEDSKLRTYHFLAHEYFHHYNVKRIRPIELGPFDYDKGSRTKMLWLSEGVSVYYEYLIVHRAGLSSRDQFFSILSRSIRDYESKPGRYFQTPAEASYNTWEDGPFGRTGDEFNKTISPYDKGAILGALLDLKIRHETKNTRSLDDLMQNLYNLYYKQKNRGFTEAEFRSEAEKIAKTNLQDFFDYIYTLKKVDYTAYLDYAGLSIDTTDRIQTKRWIGVEARQRNDSIYISNVEWNSPGWKAGLRRNMILHTIDNTPITQLSDFHTALHVSTSPVVSISFSSSPLNNKIVEIPVQNRFLKSYEIKPISNVTEMQKKILDSWLASK